MKKRILVVEDDAALARVLRDNLAFCGFDVACVTDGALALGKAREFAPDLIVLDITLPGTNGFDLCGVLRQGSRTPIIILTARSQKADKLRGLNLGADDYITKPFDLEEFLARVHAVLRRARPSVERLVLGAVVIDFRAQTATKAGYTLHLTHREFELRGVPRRAPGACRPPQRAAARSLGLPRRAQHPLGRSCHRTAAQEDRA